jgi:hypothetical protein
MVLVLMLMKLETEIENGVYWLGWAFELHSTPTSLLLCPVVQSLVHPNSTLQSSTSPFLIHEVSKMNHQSSKPLALAPQTVSRPVTSSSLHTSHISMSMRSIEWNRSEKLRTFVICRAFLREALLPSRWMNFFPS